MSIKKVIDNNFCVGCGACKISSPENIEIFFSKDGFYSAKIKEKNVETNPDNICPFSEISKNESEISKELYGLSCHKFDNRVGYYLDIFAGSVKDKTQRLSSSSGGITTWLAEKLMQVGEINCVAHVGFRNGSFVYKMSRTIDELRDKDNKKSRYYPVSLDTIAEELNNPNDRILFIGIPCYVKAIRLLQQNGKVKNIKFCFSLLCGHMKSSFFSESLAWQLGVRPDNLKKYDFRVKRKGYDSSNYFFEAIDEQNISKTAINSSLLGANWGLGFFRHKACDFCDDIAGETADITLGDAWLDKYTKDYLGTNIVLVRNKVINDLINTYKEELYIDHVDVDTFFNTQKGNYGNRRGGIISREKITKSWHPKKRLQICHEFSDINKDKIYIFRSVLSKKSISFFRIARNLNSFFTFRLLMFPYLLRYNYLLAGVSGVLKFLVPKKLKLILRKI